MAEKDKKSKYTKEEYASLEVTTPKFTVSYPHVFEMGEYQGKPTNFNVTMLFSKEQDIGELKKRLTRAKVLAWGKDPKKWPKGYTRAISDGDEEADQEGYEGNFVVKATSNKRPEVIDRDGDRITDESEIYGGCIMRAVIQAATYEIPKKKGPPECGEKFYLKALKKVDDGEKLGGGGASVSKLKDVDENEGSDDEENYEESEDDGDDDKAGKSMW